MNNTNKTAKGTGSLIGADVQHILDVTPAGTLITRISDGTVLYANQAIGNMLGSGDPADVIGKPIPDFYWDPEERNVVLAKFQADGFLTDYEMRARRATDQPLWVSFSIRPFEFSGEPVLLSTIVDITDRIMMERKLAVAEKNYHQMVDSALVAIFRTTLDGTLLEGNRTLFELSGYTSVAEINQRGLLNIYGTADTRQQMLKIIQQEGSIRGFEVEMARPDGTLVPILLSAQLAFDEAGKPAYLDGILEDITDRKQAEIALQESEARFRSLYDNSPDGFLLMEGTQFVDCNPAAVKMLGADSQDAVLTLQPFEISPEYQPNGRLSAEQQTEKLAKVAEDGYAQFEWVHIDVTGQEFTVEVTLTAFAVGDRQLLSVNWRDIEERRRMQIETQQAYERRGYQVQISTEISQEISQASELQELFTSVVTLTKERLGYYHTQLLQYDPIRDAVVLMSGYGETGAQMQAQGHQMPMGSGLIGTAAATGETVIRPTLADDPDWTPNPLLPETRGEIAVPIKLEENLLGVLDVQSSQAGALSDDDRLLLEGLCGQIAIAIEQTRLRQEVEDRLAEINQLYQAMSREGWQEFHGSADIPDAFQFDHAGVRSVSAPEIASGASFASAPLTVPGGTAIGSLSVAQGEDTPLSPDDRDFIEQVSEQVALALESARLFEQTQLARAGAETLYQIGNALNQASSEDEILEALVKPAVENGAASALLMYLDVDASGHPEWTEIVSLWPFDVEENPIPVGTRFYLPDLPISKLWIADTEHALLISDVRTDDRVDPTSKMILEQSGSRALVIIPLTRAGEQIGLLIFNWEETHEFTPREAETYNAIVDMASPAVQSRRLFSQIQLRTTELDVLNQMGSELTLLQDENAIYETILEYAGQVMNVDSFYIARYHENQNIFSLPVMIDKGKRVDMAPQPVGNNLTDYIIRSRESLLIGENFDQKVQELGLDPIIIGEDNPTVSWLGVPLLYQDRVLGVIAVQSETTSNLYGEHERDLLTAIASQAAIALENTFSFQQTQQQAEYEALINIISQRIQSTTSVENALQVAIRELGRALGAKRTSVQLGVSDQKKPGASQS